MATNVSVQTWRIAFCLCAFITASTPNQFASAQCCGGSGLSVFSGEMMSPGMIIEGDSIYLTVNLPELAMLQVNGDPTISLGPVRYFVVRGLEPGKTYTFEFAAETLNPAGVPLLEKKTVKLKAGSNDIITLKPVKRKIPRPAALSKAEDKKDAAGDEKKGDEAAAGADSASKDKESAQNNLNKSAKKISPI